MTSTPTSLDPIAQLVAKYQSNGYQTVLTEPQTTSQTKHKKGWTGFNEKTLWDWLNLLGVFLIPIVIAAASFWFSVQQNITSQNIASDQQREITLKTYMDDMTELILHEGLRDSNVDTAVSIIARAKTLIALSQLDGERKGTLIRFLYEAQLIGYESHGVDNKSVAIGSIIRLALANLSGVDLYWANLRRVDLAGADLHGANLSIAYLASSHLQWADLQGTDLFKADLQGADLFKANLRSSNLRLSNLRSSNLRLSDLRSSDLRGAKITPEQLAKAHCLKNAILPNGSRYPSTSYPILNHQEPKNC